jgi:hypothetical protein
MNAADQPSAEGAASPLGTPAARLAWWELRHARLRLAIAENDLAWAAEALAAGHMPPETALAILDDTMDELRGVRP